MIKTRRQALIVIAVMSFVLAFLPLLSLSYFILMGILTLTLRHRPALRHVSKSLFIGLWLLAGISTVGFYTSTKIVGEFDRGGTWVANHSPNTAVAHILLTPAYMWAGLLGYSCNSAYGENCSDGPIIGAAVGSTALLVAVTALGSGNKIPSNKTEK